MNTCVTPSPQSLEFKSHDGLILRGWRWGYGTRPPVLLLHGFSNDSRIWEPIAERLGREREVYSLDFRGHGDSDWDPHARYDHQTLAADVAIAVDTWGLSNFVLAGHSLGARVALIYQQHYRPKLHKAVILDTGPKVAAAGVARVRRDAEATPATFDSIEAYRQWLEAIYFLAQPEALAAMARNNLRRLNNSRWQPKTDPAFTRSLWKQDVHNGDASDLVAPLDTTLIEALGVLHCPTLVLRGQISAILRPHTAKRMVEEWLPSASLETIDGAGHALLVDQPQSVAAAIQRFIG